MLSDTGTWFTKMIRLYTKKPYNHASISFESDMQNVYSFGRKRPANPFIGGFVKENIRGELFKQATCEIYACTVTRGQLKRMKNFIRSIEQEKERYHYNVLGLLAVTVNKPLEREYRFFCSQFVAAVLHSGGVSACDKPSSLVKPHDLAEGDRFKLVFKGELVRFFAKTTGESNTLRPVERHMAV